MYQTCMLISYYSLEIYYIIIMKSIFVKQLIRKVNDTLCEFIKACIHIKDTD